MTRKKWNRLRRQYPALRLLPSWDEAGVELRSCSRREAVAAVLAWKLSGEKRIELRRLTGCPMEFVSPPLFNRHYTQDYVEQMRIIRARIETGYQLVVDPADGSVRKQHHVQTQ